MMRKLYLAILSAAAMLSLPFNASAVVDSGEPVRLVNAPEQDDVFQIEEILQSIPTPLEISVLIQEVGTVYRRSDLNNPDMVNRYSRTIKKALNLGVYGTDLGYANIYGKNQDALSYLNSVQKLADDLGVGAFFDYQTIKKLAESKGNLDELITQTTLNFEKINTHLRERKREEISVLTLTGGWIEAIYLTAMINERENNDLLKKKIGDQRLVLDRLLLVLDIYNDKDGFADLIKDLTSLQEVYAQIEVIETEGEPEMREEDGVLTVVQGKKTEVKVTDDDIRKITVLLRSLRNKIIR
ncbi:hypothetical protein [Algivirga pacifica]|uniref:Uncharacterized protein n=1 Tax=Algivirga pacifica TaxID=1162670 RepID=A0ABP9DDW2_9BACT